MSFCLFFRRAWFSVSPYTGSPPGLFRLVDPENRRTLIYFSGVRICHGRVPGIISLQVIRDGIPQLLSTVPLRTGTAVHSSIILLCSIETIFLACFFHDGVHFRNMT